MYINDLNYAKPKMNIKSFIESGPQTRRDVSDGTAFVSIAYVSVMRSTAAAAAGSKAHAAMEYA